MLKGRYEIRKKIIHRFEVIFFVFLAKEHLFDLFLL
jgi:hypothetical protein